MEVDNDDLSTRETIRVPPEPGIPEHAPEILKKLSSTLDGVTGGWLRTVPLEVLEAELMRRYSLDPH